jgi:Reverse transcriptase (RNA-dependent DNA polymerase)
MEGTGRLVAGVHLTDPNTESVYSGVVSLRGIRLVVFLAELNGLELWGSDVGNAYLEAKTKEKVYIVGGPEFGSLEGHTLLVDKALYGLRSSGLRWHERLADVLRSTGFTQYKAEVDICMRKNDGLYEDIAVRIADR